MPSFSLTQSVENYCRDNSSILYELQCRYNFQNEFIERTTNILFVINVLNFNKAELTIIILNSTRIKLKKSNK